MRQIFSTNLLLDGLEKEGQYYILLQNYNQSYSANINVQFNYSYRGYKSDFLDNLIIIGSIVSIILIINKIKY